MKSFCPRCEAEQETEVRRKQETLNVRGEAIVVDADVRICRVCGEEIVDPLLDDVTLLRAYEAYRTKHGFLGPMEVRRIRTDHGLTQREMARLLGWSPATVNRYERVGCMSQAHNTALRMLTDPQGMKRLLDERARELTPEELARFAAAFGEQAATIEQADLVAYAQMHVPKATLGRVAAMIAVLAGTAGVYTTKLMKLMFYADFAHYRSHATSISGGTYVHAPYGPILDQYDLILPLLRIMGSIDVEDRYGRGWSGALIKSRSQEAERIFTPSELFTMREVVKRFANMDAKRISEISHREKAWRETQDGQKIPYSYATSLVAL